MNNRQRLEIHEKVFYKIYLARLSYNHEKVGSILRLIDAYCFATNGSNGMQTEYEIQKAQDKILQRLDEQ